ncbi:ABC transporter permease [Sinanaerobacter chloroacetimidivorans]|uniref:ABC transporter permease n=1 Tax=Sinanaerobacter chloroacetimidivorans TaxID=2818044 RepID=A0A8J7W137_9FIRM|nr:ABC transporter permease subunit [Sinanaerobacter chloroacetimidivorans]MBR0598476.1 ABC transporter permease [Sinanaerobacter chloroacetimidivorans]
MMIEIAKKEIKDIFRNKLFLAILVMLLVLTIVSIVLGSYQVKISVDNYNNSISFLKSLGKAELPPAPNLNPISASKGFVNYIGMVGALMAIVLGNTAISKEHRNGTLRLILTRSVFRDTFMNGKLLGNLIVLAGITVVTGAITFVSLAAISGVTLSSNDVVRLLLFFLMSFLYMAFFMVLSMGVATISSKGSRALLITVIVWLVLSFVFPQIGDTMDMDNQIPGGFFSSMGMTRDQEHQVLQQFKFYETVRNGIEEISPTKHYERISFALLNVKPGFEANTPWEVVGLKWIDFLGLIIPSVGLWLLSYIAFLKRENIYQTN